MFKRLQDVQNRKSENKSLVFTPRVATLSTKMGLPDIYPIDDENQRLNKRKDAIKKSQQYLLDQQNIRKQQ